MKDMNIETIKSVYFIGAGGIGMSALIRYFLSKGKKVAGYDRTSSELTERLITEGVQIHYEENINLIPEMCKDKASTLVVYWASSPAAAKVCAWQVRMARLPPAPWLPTCCTSHTWAAPPSSEVFRRTTVRICCFPPPALIPLSKQMSSTVPSTGCHPG